MVQVQMRCRQLRSHTWHTNVVKGGQLFFSLETRGEYPLFFHNQYSETKKERECCHKVSQVHAFKFCKKFLTEGMFDLVPKPCKILLIMETTQAIVLH